MASSARYDLFSSCGRGAGGHAQVVQAAGHFHDLIDKAPAALAQGVGHDVAAFDPADDVFDAYPHAGDDLVDGLLEGVEFTPARLLLGLEGLCARWFVTLEGAVLEDQRARRVRRARSRQRASCRARCPGSPKPLLPHYELH